LGTISTLIGTSLGPYEIQSLLGHGGMSAVYQGFDTNLQRRVAIKVLADAVAHQPGFTARFRQEALLLAGMRHPHIVQVYDYGEHDGATFMVQELLPGPTLERRLAELKQRDASLSRDEIVMVARQIASALDAAHAAGIIHRDVKPSNMLWNAAGALVLADFGVAKALEEERLTQTGVVFGTPIYLSPEQAQGQPLAPSSDIYSLGVVLYELIAGHPPFEGASSLGVALSHVQQPPPRLRGSRTDLPPAAEAVVLRALAKRPDARFRSAGDLAEALERAWPSPLSPYTSATFAMRPATRAGGALARRLHVPARALPALVIVLALLAGSAGWLALRRPADPADAALAQSLPTVAAFAAPSIPATSVPAFAALDPTSIPADAVIAVSPSPTAPAAPVAAPVVAPLPAAPPAPAQPSLSSTPAHSSANQPGAGGQPKPAQPKPPKPDKPKPAQPKPPKPDKPSGKNKGGGKGK
jgi:hypothetical protein